MSKKKLPKIKKTVSSFVTNEDAKVMNKTATKLAVSSTFIVSVILINAEGGNALFSHSNHEEHSNVAYVHNIGREGLDVDSSRADKSVFSVNFDLFASEEATVSNTHSNHIDHSNSGSFFSRAWDSTIGELFGESWDDVGLGTSEDEADPDWQW